MLYQNDPRYSYAISASVRLGGWLQGPNLAGKIQKRGLDYTRKVRHGGTGMFDLLEVVYEKSFGHLEEYFATSRQR